MEKYNEIEIKKDCFAYRETKGALNTKNMDCNALTELFCKKEICPFYKSKKNS